VEVAVPVRHVRLPSWTALVFLIFGAALIPWTVWLAFSLPHRYVTDNYDLTWVGFDVALTALLFSVMWLARRGSRYVEPVCAAAGTMLLVDAWFDVTSARPGRDTAIAVATASLFELPIAALCWWLVRNAGKLRGPETAGLRDSRRSSRLEKPTTVKGLQPIGAVRHECPRQRLQ
jgi:hypothetical protein